MSTYRGHIFNCRPNTQDEFVYQEVYLDNCYRLPDDLSGKVVIDIGANIGAFTVACLDRNAEAVYAYEPDPGNYAQLLVNIGSHPRKDRSCVVNKFVVGDSNQQLKISHWPGYETHEGTLLTGGKSLFSGSSGLSETPFLTQIETVKIDGVILWASSWSKNPNLWLKLDCEGAEYQILDSNLPWERIERIFGECHTLIDGKLSRDATTVDDTADFLAAPYVECLVDRLVSVGYHTVRVEPNPNDIHLHLFWAENWGVNVELEDETILDLDGDKVDTARWERGYTIQTAIKTVCVLTPFRNARKYLSLYFRQIGSLRDALKSKGYSLRLVAAEGDSLDGTRERIFELADQYGISLTVVDTTHGHLYWRSVEDPTRMRVMSEVMNKALEEVKESDDVVIWIMSDLEWSVESLIGLIDSVLVNPFSVFAPMVYADKEEKFFWDTWAFRVDGKRFINERPFHPSLEDESSDIFELDSAGTCLVMRWIIARKTRASNLEAVSFCQRAIELGYNITLNTNLKVFHSPSLPKRLLWVSDAVCISGFSRVSHAMFPILSEAGYELDIVARNYWGTPHNYPYRIFPANVNGDYLGGEMRVKMLVSGMEKAGRPYDAIVTLDDFWSVKGLVDALDDPDISNIPPVIPWVMVDGKNAQGEGLNHKTIKFVASPSKFGVDELLQHGMTKDSGVIPFGVDTSIFRPLDRTESRSLVSSKDVPIDSFIVGCVANNQLRKNLKIHLEYFAEWVRGRDDAYLYLCLGSSNSHGCDIVKLIHYYGLQRRVIINSSLVSDQVLAHVYNSFDVYLSLPLGEGFGLTALEAMACGVPCIVSDWSGYSSWIPEGCAIKVPCTSTMLSSPLNSQAYILGGVASKECTISAIDRLYRGKSLRDGLGARGLELAKSLSWKSAGERLVEILEKTLAENTK